MTEGKTVLMIRKTFKASGVLYERGQEFDQAKAGMSGDKLRLLMSQRFISPEPVKEKKPAPPPAAPKPVAIPKKKAAPPNPAAAADVPASETPSASTEPLTSPSGWTPGDPLPQSGGALAPAPGAKPVIVKRAKAAKKAKR